MRHVEKDVTIAGKMWLHWCVLLKLGLVWREEISTLKESQPQISVVKFFVSNFFNFQGCLRTGCLNGGSCIYCENSYACSCKEPQTEEKKGRTLGKGKFIVCLLKYPFSRIAVVKVLAVLWRAKIWPRISQPKVFKLIKYLRIVVLYWVRILIVKRKLDKIEPLIVKKKLIFKILH